MRRSQLRDLALCFLYQISVQKEDIEEQQERFLEMHQLNPEEKAFFDNLVQGVRREKPQLDAEIEPLLKDWRMSRLPLIEQAIMRMGLWELRYSDDVPDSVAISEAVILAKRYGNEDASRYINAVLGKLAAARTGH